MATVLVVDDSATNRQLVVTLLAYKHHRPLEAADGAEALLVAKKERPDLVICDILMPTMDGYEFVRQLRAEPTIARTEVIFYSASYREQQAHDLARACGVTRVLIKPCEPEEIIDVIEQALAHEATPEIRTITEGFDREHLRLVTDKLSEKANNLESANQRLSALIDLNLQLASERNPHALLDKVCRGARDLIGAKYAVLCVKEKNDGEAIYSTVSGFDASIAIALPPRIDNDVLGPVVSERRVLRVANPDRDPRAIGLPADYPSANSALVCPIASLDVTYGWICLGEKLGAEEFSEDDESLLSIHTAQVGRIYENGSLYARMQRHAARLQESESLLRERDAALRRAQLMAKLAHAVTLPDGSFESWSETLPPLLDVEAAKMPASTRDWINLVHPDDRAAFRATVVDAAAAGARKDVAYRLRRGDGWIHVRQAIEPLQDQINADGRVRWFSMLQDVTELQQAEERVRRLNRVYAVLSGINALIVRARDRNELFREACRIAVETGQFLLAWIGIVDRQAMQVKPVAWHGAGENYIHLMPLGLDAETPATFGLAGLVVTERKAMVADNMTSDLRIALSAEAAARDFRSLAILPLLVSGEAVGVMALYTSEVGFFDADEMKLLLELGGDIAFALDHIAKEEKVHYLAYHDTLTGLANRALFHELLAQYVERASAERRKFAVIFIDIDDFKTINDSLGRQAGDELLKQVAARLRRDPGHAGAIARISADRFGAVVHDIKHETDVSHAIDELINRSFDAPYIINGSELKIAARVGIALYPRDGGDAEALLKNVEVALRKAKTTDEKRVFYTQEMAQIIAERILLENRLHQAFDREEFVLHYQPKVDLESRQIQGVEALIRWQSPDLGLVPPLKFISVLEETGMILEVGAWALRRAVLDHRHLLRQKLMAPRVAVNVSAVQLRQPNFISVVRDILRLGANRPGIDIEITESLIMEDVAGAIDKLRTLRDLGVSIAIDDFGTGYSSLGYLARLPVHSLKIDRSFIEAMVDNPDTMTLVSTIISLAHSLRLKVCAEGVETEEQAKVLRLLRCDEMQGFLICRPVPLEELTLRLAPSGTQ